MCCFPPTKNEVGGAKMPDVVGNSHLPLQVDSSAGPPASEQAELAVVEQGLCRPLRSDRQSR